jgi:hypothetical protein
VLNPANPQSLNRYSYCLNNPLKYIDPSGHVIVIPLAVVLVGAAAISLVAVASVPILYQAGVFDGAEDVINDTIKNASEWIRNKKRMRNEEPDFSMPNPNNYNIWKNPKNLKPWVQAVLVGIGIVIGVTRTYENNSPQLPAGNNPTDFTASWPQLKVLNYLGYDVGSPEYRQLLDYAYYSVVANLAENEIARWSSNEGYHAVDPSSEDYDWSQYHWTDWI